MFPPAPRPIGREAVDLAAVEKIQSLTTAMSIPCPSIAPVVLAWILELSTMRLPPRITMRPPPSPLASSCALFRKLIWPCCGNAATELGDA